MLDAFKVLFILTGASTYLVTKYIRVGVDDKNDTLPYYKSEEPSGSITIEPTSITLDSDGSAGIGNGQEAEDLAGNRLKSSTTVSSTADFEYSSERTIIKNISNIKNSSNKKVAGKSTARNKNKNHRIASSEETNSGNYTTAIFHINDVQDNPSSMGRPTFEIEINEEDKRNLPQKLLQVTVSDDNHSSNQQITYRLHGEGMDVKPPGRSKFGINETSGDIYALMPLDRDEKTGIIIKDSVAPSELTVLVSGGRPQWRLAVYARDSRNQALVGYADVIVNLKDVNDNPPVFATKFVYGNVSENRPAGVPVLKLTAEDADDPKEGQNAKISYLIKKIQPETSDAFLIDSMTGVIRTAKSFDREFQSEYRFLVLGTDGGGLQGSATVTISIIDVNDSPPRFAQKQYAVEIDESTFEQVPKTPILVVSVIDDDLPTTNNFAFEILNNSKHAQFFSLLPNPDRQSASLRVLRPLDYEDSGLRTINLTLTVSDRNFTYYDFVDRSEVVIKVRDVNDNIPRLVKSSMRLTVAEDTPVGSVIAKLFSMDSNQALRSVQTPSTTHGQVIPELFAIDDDEKNSGNGPPFTFRIDPDAPELIRDTFKVLHDGNSKALLYTRKVFDRHVNKEYLIPIVIKDNGIPPQVGTSTLTISIGQNQEPKEYPLSLIAIAAIGLCVINIPLIFLIMFFYYRFNNNNNNNINHNNNRQQTRRRVSKSSSDDKDIRENIMSYTDEGGEDDIKAYDMTTLRIQVCEPQMTSTTSLAIKCNNFNCNASARQFNQTQKIAHEHLADIIRDHLEKIDCESSEDQLLRFASEGSGLTEGSLSSISSVKSSDDKIKSNNIVFVNNNNNNDENAFHF